jgi:hypothetical protein
LWSGGTPIGATKTVIDSSLLIDFGYLTEKGAGANAPIRNL